MICSPRPARRGPGRPTRAGTCPTRRCGPRPWWPPAVLGATWCWGGTTWSSTGGTAGLQLRHALHFDEAHAARADRRAEARLVTEDRDLDAGRRGRLDQAGALRHLNRPLVDGNGDELARDLRHGFATFPWERFLVPSPLAPPACRRQVTVLSPFPGNETRLARTWLIPGPRRPGSACAWRSVPVRGRARTRRRTGSRPARCAR